MKRKILGFLVAVMTASVSLTAVATAPVAAEGTNSCGLDGFLGLRPWYYGLCDGDEATSKVKEPANDTELKSFVWRIALNILIDLLVLVGYASMIFIIYGGYQFMSSQGDPGKAAAGKKTLTSAIIGMVIALSASVIVNTGMVILSINSAGGTLENCDGDGVNCVGENFQQTQIQNAFTWAYTVAGLVAVAFIVYGGIKYATSQGDPGKARAGTQTIIYAAVGLVVTLLAAAITSFVIRAATGT